jgi:hypothetical protein
MGAWDQWDELLAQSAPDPLEVLTLAAQYDRYLNAIMSRAVPAARSAGYTWEQIGGAVGTSRQAVWQRYRTAWKETVPATLEWSPGPFGFMGPPRLIPGGPDHAFGDAKRGDEEI